MPRYHSLMRSLKGRLYERGESVLAALVLAGIAGSLLLAFQYFSPPARPALGQAAAVEVPVTGGIGGEIMTGSTGQAAPAATTGSPPTGGDDATGSKTASQADVVKAQCNKGEVHVISEVTVEAKKKLDAAGVKDEAATHQKPQDKTVKCWIPDPKVDPPNPLILIKNPAITDPAEVKYCKESDPVKCVVMYCPISYLNPKGNCMKITCTGGAHTCLQENLGTALNGPGGSCTDGTTGTESCIAQKLADLQQKSPGQESTQILTPNGTKVSADDAKAAANTWDPAKWQIVSNQKKIDENMEKLDSIDASLYKCQHALISCYQPAVDDWVKERSKLTEENAALNDNLTKQLDALAKAEQGSIAPPFSATKPWPDTTGTVPTCVPSNGQMVCDGSPSSPTPGTDGSKPLTSIGGVPVNTNPAGQQYATFPNDPAKQDAFKKAGYLCTANGMDSSQTSCVLPPNKGICPNGQPANRVTGACDGSAGCPPGTVSSVYGCKQPCEINGTCAGQEQGQQPRTQAECQAAGRMWTAEYGCAIVQGPPGGVQPYASPYQVGYGAGNGAGGLVNAATRSGLFYQMGYMLGSLFRDDNKGNASASQQQVACAKNQDQYNQQIQQYNQMVQQFNMQLQQTQYQCQQSPYGYGGYGGYGGFNPYGSSPYGNNGYQIVSTDPLVVVPANQGYGGSYGYSNSIAPVGYPNSIGTAGCGSSGWTQPRQPPRPPSPCYDNARPSQCQNSPARPSGQCSGTWKPLTASQNGCVTGWQCVPNSASGGTGGTSTTSTSGTSGTGGTGGAGGTGGSASGIATSGEVSAQISCQPKVVDPGMTIAISFGCANATDSSGSGFDTGGALAGSKTAVAAALSGSVRKVTYSLTCSGATGVATAHCDVEVSKASIVFLANPRQVRSGEAATLAWITSGMRACIVSSIDFAEFTAQNANVTNVNGVARTPPLTKDATFILRCESVSGVASEQTTTVKVQP